MQEIQQIVQTLMRMNVEIYIILYNVHTIII